ncbi:hypothetical protein OSTOST_11698 [Ostertagia ostertagi]
MGEGEAKSDAKDVTDEMEESGQIEGLQDDECEPPTGDAGQNEKPIEMEEDFPEDIQDIDRNEPGDDNEKSGDESEEEPEPEDQMGDVDEADDQQLDPKLWDEEEKDSSPKGTDEDNAQLRHTYAMNWLQKRMTQWLRTRSQVKMKRGRVK